MIYFKARHIESRDFSRVGRSSHAVFCLHHLLPYVGNIGTNGFTNGTIGKTLNEICLPMVPFLPLEKTTNARNVCSHCDKKDISNCLTKPELQQNIAYLIVSLRWLIKISSYRK